MAAKLDISSARMHPPAALPCDAMVLEQARRLCPDPFSTALRREVEGTFVDTFSGQDAYQAVQHGARMFEQARRDPQLTPPLRHALLQTLERALARASSSYQLAGAPLGKIDALDRWRASVPERVLDAIARCESGCAALPLSQAEEVIEHHQYALLGQLSPTHSPMLEKLLRGQGTSSAWMRCFAQHLRRILFLTFDATLGASDVRRLLDFLPTPAGRACLALRAGMAPLPAPSSAAAAPPDPSEMCELQGAMAEMLGAAAGTDALERQAYCTELAERMVQRLCGDF